MIYSRSTCLLHQTSSREGFTGTLKSVKMVSKQAEEWQLQSELREQMQGYKRMRQQHKSQVSVWACGGLYLEITNFVQISCLNIIIM